MLTFSDAKALFLQPHYDDAALSCGGTIARYGGSGHATMITVFASELLPAMVGDFAAWKHARWRLEDPDAVVETRRSEDAAAARVLGADLRWLGMPDAIYRGDNYSSDAQLYGDLHPLDLELAAFLAVELEGLPEWDPAATVFVPLGVGSHADHKLVFETGRILAQAGVRVLAYVDCPYAIHTPEGVAERLAAVSASLGEPVLVPVADTLERRIAAIGCYATQLPVIFRFTDDYAEAVRTFAESTGGALGPAEQFWPVAG